jgi:hypothetical protein
MRTFPRGLSLLLLICLAVPGSGADKREKKKSAYSNVEISAFDVKKGIDVPQDFLDRLAKQLPHRLADTKKFKQVSSHGESPAGQNGPALQMTGTVVEFNSGSRAKRYLVGFGVGAADVVAHIKFTDTAKGETVFERDVTAKMTGGGFGGSINGVADELAREIARVVKRESF